LFGASLPLVNRLTRSCARGSTERRQSRGGGPERVAERFSKYPSCNLDGAKNSGVVQDLGGCPNSSDLAQVAARTVDEQQRLPPRREPPGG
jgi:hypothetical protein